MFEGVASPCSPANLHKCNPQSWGSKFLETLCHLRLHRIPVPGSRSQVDTAVCATVSAGLVCLCWSLEIIATHYQMGLDRCVLFIFVLISFNFHSVSVEILFLRGFLFAFFFQNSYCRRSSSLLDQTKQHLTQQIYDSAQDCEVWYFLLHLRVKISTNVWIRSWIGKTSVTLLLYSLQVIGFPHRNVPGSQTK